MSVRFFDKELPCDLSDDELQKHGLLLAECDVQRERARREKQVMLKNWGAKDKEFAIQGAKLADEIKTKKQTRTVRCYEKNDDTKLEVQTFRDDLNMVIETRPMTSEERQMVLGNVVPIKKEDSLG